MKNGYLGLDRFVFTLLLSLLHFGCEVTEFDSEQESIHNNLIKGESNQKDVGLCHTPETSVTINPNRILQAGHNDARISLNSGLNFYKIKSASPFTDDSSSPGYGDLISGNVFDVAISNQNIWYIATSNGISISRDEGKSFKNIYLNQNGVFLSKNSLTILKDGSLYVVTSKSILHLTEDGRVLNAFFNENEGRRLQDLEVNKDGHIYILTSKQTAHPTIKNLAGDGPAIVSLFSIFKSTDCGNSFAEIYSESNPESLDRFQAVYDIDSSDSGNLMIGHASGLSVLNRNAEIFKIYSQSSVGSNLGRVQDILIADQKIYLATSNGLAASTILNNADLTNLSFDLIAGKSKYGVGSVSTIAKSASLGILFNNWGLFKSNETMDFYLINENSTDGQGGDLISKIVAK